MDFEQIDIKDLKSEKEENGIDRRFQRFLMTTFGEMTAKIVYRITISIIVFFKKICLFLSLPFKFVQFFIDSLNHSNKQN